MYIDVQPVLNKVDHATRFSPITFVSPIAIESVWEKILKLRANLYSGISKKLVFDEGSQFSDALIEIRELHDVKLNK